MKYEIFTAGLIADNNIYMSLAFIDGCDAIYRLVNENQFFKVNSFKACENIKVLFMIEIVL